MALSGLALGGLFAASEGGLERVKTLEAADTDSTDWDDCLLRPYLPKEGPAAHRFNQFSAILQELCQLSDIDRPAVREIGLDRERVATSETPTGKAEAGNFTEKMQEITQQLRSEVHSPVQDLTTSIAASYIRDVGLIGKHWQDSMATSIGALRQVILHNCSQSPSNLKMHWIMDTGLAKATRKQYLSALKLLASSGYLNSVPFSRHISMTLTDTLPGPISREGIKLFYVEQEIRTLLEQGRVRDAYILATWASENGLESRSIARWVDILKPRPTRSASSATGRRRNKEEDWLRRHGHDYKGQWVALLGDRLIASSPDFSVVKETISTEICHGDILLHFVSKGTEQ
jgi:hypothetical protein